MSNRAKLFIPAVFFVAMLGLLFYGLGQNPNLVPSALVNRPLPEFSLPALFETNGVVGSEQLKGGIYLVNFWATSCVTCVAEMPKLISTHQKYAAQGFDTLAASLAASAARHKYQAAVVRKGRQRSPYASNSFGRGWRSNP